MKLLGTIKVRPELPKRLAGLGRLARNLWWAWHPEAVRLFADLDKRQWQSGRENPVRFLALLPQDRLEKAAADAAYCKRYDAVMQEFDDYIKREDTWFKRSFPKQSDQLIAYFSAEFGLHECLPIYSGGLGVLSGDHLKTASDLGIPLVGVGLVYNHGYFVQRINQEGQQEASYQRLDFDMAPIRRATDPDGQEVIVQVEMPDRRVEARVWLVEVGRVRLFLLDTDLPDNSDSDRRLSAQLYGGDIHMRIAQEKILGIGGVRALRQMGIAPTVWHMNEGHSAFLTLERLRELVQSDGLNWHEAVEAMAPSVCFTTHTPVPAGHDVFDQTMMEGHFWSLRAALGMTADEFMKLGQEGNPPAGLFSLTVLAMRMSRYRNGVSALHGEVSRSLWTKVWPGLPESEVPVRHITNGIHVPTWLAAPLADLFDRHLKDSWREEPQDPKNWKEVDKIPTGELWKVHQGLKKAMVDAVRKRIKLRAARLGEPVGRQGAAADVLDPDALTIGFARRFATYKRAVLLFTDLERLHRLLHDPQRPMQLVFAGKAHPADLPGQQFIRQIYEFSRSSEFAGKVVIVEDYDMELARALVAGVDVWLNNPRRPLEASGTSGQKAAMNGVLNFSVLDGWWAEGYNGKNGWKIGEPIEFATYDEQDLADVTSLYATLEDEIIPLYYDRDRNDLPALWVERMKESIRTLSPLYSTHRMLVDYCNEMYIPAAKRAREVSAKNFAQARSIAEWRGRVNKQWSHVAIQAQVPAEDEIARGQKVSFRAWATLGKLDPKDVRVEVLSGPVENGAVKSPATTELRYTGRENGVHLFEGEVAPQQTGSIGFGVRVRPVHPDLKTPDESGKLTWASSIN